MDLAVNPFIAPETASATERGKNGAAVTKDREGNSVKFKDFLRQSPSRKTDSPLEKIQEKLKKLLAMGPEIPEEKLEELMDEFPEEFMALLNFPIDYLVQELQPAISGYSPEELKSLLLNIRGSANDQIFQMASSGANIFTDRSFEIMLDISVGEEVPTTIAGNESTVDKIPLDEFMDQEELLNTEIVAEGEMGNTVQPAIAGIEKENRGEFILPERGETLVLDAMNSDGQQQKEVSTDENITAVNGSRQQEILQNNPATITESGDEFIPVGMKTDSEDFSTTLRFFRGENQLFTQKADTEDALTKDSANSEGQSAYFADRSSWIEYITEPVRKDLPETTETDLEGIIEQISSRMQIQRQAGRNRIELQLEPDSLGKVRLELEVENTELTARLLVDNEKVKSYLEQNLDGLKSSLLKQGFNLGKIQVESRELAYQEHYYSQQEYQQQQENDKRERKDRNNFLAEELETGGSLRISLEDEPVITGPSRWVHLNYSRHKMDLLA